MVKTLKVGLIFFREICDLAHEKYPFYKDLRVAYEKGLFQLPKRVLVSTVCTACTDG